MNTKLCSHCTGKNNEKFLWENSTPKIKHNTLCNDYKNGGLKNVDIRKKLTSLQCLCIENCTPSFQYIFGKSFIFHSNLSFKKNLIKSFPSFYKEILLNWKTFLARTPETPSCILSQLLWYNIHIQIDESDLYFTRFSQKDLNFVSQLCDTNVSVKTWHHLKRENLNNSYFQWLQLINAIPEKRKFTIKQTGGYATKCHYSW